MATKKDLIAEVNRLNNKYCKGGKNKLVVDYAYGGYQVCLTGKKTKAGKYYKGSLCSGKADVTVGHGSATQTLNYLYEADSKGWVRNNVKYHNR